MWVMVFAADSGTGNENFSEVVEKTERKDSQCSEGGFRGRATWSEQNNPKGITSEWTASRRSQSTHGCPQD